MNGGAVEVVGDFPFTLSIVEAFLGFSAESIMSPSSLLPTPSASGTGYRQIGLAANEFALDVERARPGAPLPLAMSGLPLGSNSKLSVTLPSGTTCFDST
jgi:hypothetical protein